MRSEISLGHGGVFFELSAEPLDAIFHAVRLSAPGAQIDRQNGNNFVGKLTFWQFSRLRALKGLAIMGEPPSEIAGLLRQMNDRLAALDDRIAAIGEEVRTLRDDQQLVREKIVRLRLFLENKLP